MTFEHDVSGFLDGGVSSVSVPLLISLKLLVGFQYKSYRTKALDEGFLMVSS